MTTNEAPNVWIGLKRCGCPVAVVVDRSDTPNEHTEESKREYLKQGLSVVFATWDEWQTKYFPNFLRDCEHDKARRAAKVTP